MISSNEYLSSLMKKEKVGGSELFSTMMKTLALSNEEILKLLNETHNVKKLEIIALLLGCVSSQQIFDMNYLFCDDYDGLLRALSRHSKNGYMESIRLKGNDANVRKIYGLTPEGFNRVFRHVSSISDTDGSYCLKNLALRKPSFHEYGISLSLMSLYRAGFEYDFEKEVVSSDALINTEDSVRTDAILHINGKEYYLEQDMGTESQAKLVSKIKMYDDPNKTLIFTFHKIVPSLTIAYPDTSLFLDGTNFLPLGDVLGRKDITLKPNEKKFLYLAKAVVGKKGTITDISSKVKQIGILDRAVKLEAFKESRMLNMLEKILAAPSLYRFCDEGMDIYCHQSELLCHSNAFKKQDYTPLVQKLFKDRLSSKEAYFEFEGIMFKNAFRLKEGSYVAIERVEENLGGLVRMMNARKKESGNYFILVVNTITFAHTLAKLLFQGHRNLSNFIITDENGYETFVSKSGKIKRRDMSE
ncbi:MAG: replication-relaxation family protein [Lachnospiraceae bacterium]|nr:replication-relaxation family protein [Lachnospiraceae bacterium]